MLYTENTDMNVYNEFFATVIINQANFAQKVTIIFSILHCFKISKRNSTWGEWYVCDWVGHSSWERAGCVV